MTFRTRLEAIAFYDALETAKGPSLGTNFTLRLVPTKRPCIDRTDTRQLPVHTSCTLHRTELGKSLAHEMLVTGTNPARRRSTAWSQSL